MRGRSQSEDLWKKAESATIAASMMWENSSHLREKPRTKDPISLVLDPPFQNPSETGADTGLAFYSLASPIMRVLEHNVSEIPPRD